MLPRNSVPFASSSRPTFFSRSLPIAGVKLDLPDVKQRRGMGDRSSRAYDLSPANEVGKGGNVEEGCTEGENGCVPRTGLMELRSLLSLSSFSSCSWDRGTMHCERLPEYIGYSAALTSTTCKHHKVWFENISATR
jgi:hypothetical protein